MLAPFGFRTGGAPPAERLRVFSTKQRSQSPVDQMRVPASHHEEEFESAKMGTQTSFIE